MSKRLSLADSLRQAAQADAGTSPAAPTPFASKLAAKEPPPGFHAATRAGKKKVTAPLAPEDHKRLRRLALEHDVTTEALLIEAIRDLFAKYEVGAAGQGGRSR